MRKVIHLFFFFSHGVQVVKLSAFPFLCFGKVCTCFFYSRSSKFILFFLFYCRSTLFFCNFQIAFFLVFGPYNISQFGCSYSTCTNAQVEKGPETHIQCKIFAHPYTIHYRNKKNVYKQKYKSP